MKKLLVLSGVALMVASSFSMAGNGDGKGKRNFTDLDVNGDGVITVEETTGKMAKHFDSLDSDGDGSITEVEFDARKGKGRK